MDGDLFGDLYKCDLNGTYRYVLGPVEGCRAPKLVKGLLTWRNGKQIPQVVPEYNVVTPLIESHAHLPEIGLKNRFSYLHINA